MKNTHGQFFLRKKQIVSRGNARFYSTFVNEKNLRPRKITRTLQKFAR